MARVQLEHVDKIYDGAFKVVHDFNLDIADGEFIVLVGPSGCGKSTTLRMVAGLEDISSGTIKIGDRIVNDVTPKDRDIAMVFQNYALYPHMTVFDNMGFALQLRGVSKVEIEKKVHRAADVLGIRGLLDRRPKALSGGQRQRVALGRAIVRAPRCFLFDEPLSNLDAKLRVEMRAELKQLHLDLGATTIYVTHDQEEAMTLGDRVVVMRDGVVQQVGSATEIYHAPRNSFVAGFLGSPPMNFLKGSLVEEGGQLYFDEGAGKLPVPAWAKAKLTEQGDREVVLGVRPELLSDGEGARFAKGDNQLEMNVQLVQPLGERMNAYLSTGKHDKVVAQLHAFSKLRPGQKVPIYVDLDRVHFFSSDDEGKALAINTASLH
jgi:multiple sugar transport system ATP-binding protein